MTSYSQRPILASDLTGSEFLRWYWLKAELVSFARSAGIRTTGDKELLTRRIAAHLDGRAFTEPANAKSRSGRQLSGELSPDTVIPVGQRCSQVLRAWFTQTLGTAFHFDAEMRNFLATTDGTQTLSDAIAHWHQTRDVEPKAIGNQFEYNRFTRAWHDNHPDGSQDELLAAWREYRDQPTDVRGRV